MKRLCDQAKIKKINGAELEVEYQPLFYQNDKLALGLAILQKVCYKIDNSGFIENPEIGDF